MLSEKLARVKMSTSKLGTRLGKVETKRDAAEARYDEVGSLTVLKSLCSARKKRF